MPGNKITAALDIKNQKVRRDIEEVISSIEKILVKEFGSNLPFDLLILEIGDDLEKNFRLVQSIQASGQVGEVFLTSSRLEPDLLIKALRTGVKEFIPQPVNKEEVRKILLGFIERLEHSRLADRKEAGKGKIINVLGSKGGVGTTTIAVNLATSLVKGSPRPASVVLLDMNLIFGEIPLFLNIQPEFNWAEVARNISRLDSHYLMSILSRHSTGIYVLPPPTGLDEINVATPDIIERILELMRKNFDFIIIDSGQPLDEVSLKILEISDLVFLISVLSLPGLTNVKRLLWTFAKLGYPQNGQIKIIINRYHKKSLISLKEAEGTLNQKIFGLVENDYLTTMSAINQGKSLEMIAPKAEVTKNIKNLASSLVGSKIG